MRTAAPITKVSHSRSRRPPASLLVNQQNNATTATRAIFERGFPGMETQVRSMSVIFTYEGVNQNADRP